MKKISFTILFVGVASLAFCQSKSYQALQDHFADKEDVHTFSLSGFFCRAALSIALPEEKMLRAMAKDIRHIRLMVIPKEAFRKQDLTVNGFKNLLTRDSFESVASIRDHGDHVTIFHRPDGNQKDRYFVLVEEPNEVVAIEMKGTIDPSLFKNEDNRITINQP